MSIVCQIPVSAIKEAGGRDVVRPLPMQSRGSVTASSDVHLPCLSWLSLQSPVLLLIKAAALLGSEANAVRLRSLHACLTRCLLLVCPRWPAFFFFRFPFHCHTLTATVMQRMQ